MSVFGADSRCRRSFFFFFSRCWSFLSPLIGGNAPIPSLDGKCRQRQSRYNECTENSKNKQVTAVIELKKRTTTRCFKTQSKRAKCALRKLKQKKYICASHFYANLAYSKSQAQKGLQQMSRLTERKACIVLSEENDCLHLFSASWLPLVTRLRGTKRLNGCAPSLIGAEVTMSIK